MKITRKRKQSFKIYHQSVINMVLLQLTLEKKLVVDAFLVHKFKGLLH
jgi:hypothetical protein